MSKRIVNLEISNVMRIKAVSIKPDGGVVILGGRNAQGKTSVIDSICMAIGGKNLCPDMPIRDGETGAEINLNLGDLSICRSFTAKPNGGYASKLTVKNKEGQPLARPQQMLDDLVGRLAFDPLEFARMKPTAARETLRALVGLDVEQLEEEKGNVYREREEAGRTKRAAQAVVDDMPVPGEVPERISTDSITDEMTRANDAVTEFEKLKATADRAHENYMTASNTVDRLQNELADAEAEVTRHLEASAAAAELVRTFEVPDFDEIKTRLDSALEFNGHAEAIRGARARYAEKVAEAEKTAETWKALDVKHGDLFHEIKKRTEAVEYPIEELELRPEGVFYQGVPFDQGSRAERIKVSMAMGVAMNKELGILLIRDGSVLDEDSMTMIAELAEKHSMQFWVEMARGYEGSPGAIVIEDGEVVS